MRIIDAMRARWRAMNPFYCLGNPRPDVLRGMRKWKWLNARRKEGCTIDPSTEVRIEGQEGDTRLHMGINTAIDKGCILWLGQDEAAGRISIGKNVYIGPYCFIGSCHQLAIGDHTLIGAHSYLITANHRITDPELPYGSQGYTGGDVTLGRNVWLGAKVVVLPGVTIGDNAIVGAGAVVTRDIPANETWAGVPARKIK